ncbi:MAG: DUF3182 family protein [Pseudomonas sp.]|uniref:DUF3182 family protein n=1 Tax=Pseudomonas sp. TaxID=306 RepID=UPI0033998EA2
MSQTSALEQGCVVLYPNRASEPEHERVVHAELGRRLAQLQGLGFAGDYRPAAAYAGPLYFVPSGTLVGQAELQRLGIHGELQLFGGAAWQDFVPTKAISHPLLAATAAAPPGWSHDFGERIQGCVLKGLTVFSAADALLAGERLLSEGPLRIKPVRATAGRGQQVIGEARTLRQAIADQDDRELQRFGLVLEENLQQVVTYSVGQVRVADLVASYYGTQRLTHDNTGESVYGGSDLVVVRGGFEALLSLELDDQVRRAIAQAQVYDSAASACFAGFFASRRNYDVARGVDVHGQPRSGVLEQSWRIGGASSAEIAALQAFRGDERLSVLRAASLELYGPRQRPPASSDLLFSGEDAEVGFINKSVRVQPYGHA